MTVQVQPSFDVAAVLAALWVDVAADGTLHRFDSVALLSDTRVSVIGVAREGPPSRHVHALWRVRLPDSNGHVLPVVDVLWREAPDQVVVARAGEVGVHAAGFAGGDLGCLRELSDARAAYRERVIGERRADGRGSGPPSDDTLHRILAEARVIDCTRRAEAVLTRIASQAPCADLA